MEDIHYTYTHNSYTVSGAGPTTTTIPLEELPGWDEGRRDGVYDLPSENGGVYGEVTKTEEPPPSPGEYARFNSYMRLHN